MHIDVIRDWSALSGMASDWSFLLNKSKHATIFQTWEWANAWATSIQHSLPPYIITVKDNKQNLLAIAPFYLSRLKLCKLLPLKTLRAIGDRGSGAEYPQIICSEDQLETMTSVIMAFLISQRDWDCLWLPNHASWTPHIKSLHQTTKRLSRICVQTREMTFSSIDLPESFSLYIQTLSKSRRSYLRQLSRQYDHGKYQVRFCTRQEELPSFIDTLFSLHEIRWANEGLPGSFNKAPSMKTFYRLFAEQALNQGWLRLYQLLEDDQPIATQIGYQYNDTFYALQEGFDIVNHPGAGNYLRAKIIESCISQNISSYDFLGVHTRHKQHWRAQARTGYDLFAWRKNQLSTLAFNVKTFWPTGRFLQPETGGLTYRIDRRY